MIGAACSSLAFVTAWLVARREPRHKAIRDALAIATLHAGVVALEWWLDLPPSPLAELALWMLVAVFSARVYLEAWSPDPWALPGLCGLCVAVWTCAAVDPARWWLAATWGPFVASSVVGGFALYRWYVVTRDRSVERVEVNGWPALRITTHSPPWTFTQRVALALLVSDVCMLLFVAIGSEVAQAWQGRVSALVVAGMQGVYLWQTKKR